MKLNDIIVLNEQPGNKENETFKKAPPPGDVGDQETTAQAAKELGVTPSRVRQMKMEKKFKTVKGPVEGRRDNLIRTSEVKSKKENRRGPGRPSKKSDTKKDE
jgi:hypothetical protein